MSILSSNVLYFSDLSIFIYISFKSYFSDIVVVNVSRVFITSNFDIVLSIIT